MKIIQSEGCTTGGITIDGVELADLSLTDQLNVMNLIYEKLKDEFLSGEQPIVNLWWKIDSLLNSLDCDKENDLGYCDQCNDHAYSREYNLEDN